MGCSFQQLSWQAAFAIQTIQTSTSPATLAGAQERSGKFWILLEKQGSVGNWFGQVAALESCRSSVGKELCWEQRVHGWNRVQDVSEGH